MKTMYYVGLTLGVLALAACGSDSSSGPSLPVSIVGTFSLQTINTDTVPTLLSYDRTDSVETDLLSDVYTFNLDLTFSEQRVTRTWHGSTVTNQTVTNTGTYTQNSTAVTIIPADGATMLGSLNGAGLTVVDSSSVYFYHKTQATD